MLNDEILNSPRDIPVLLDVSLGVTHGHSVSTFLE